MSSHDECAFAVLVFSKTAGYRHDSIPAGVAAIKALGERKVKSALLLLEALVTTTIDQEIAAAALDAITHIRGNDEEWAKKLASYALDHGLMTPEELPRDIDAFPIELVQPPASAASG